MTKALSKAKIKKINNWINESYGGMTSSEKDRQYFCDEIKCFADEGEWKPADDNMTGVQYVDLVEFGKKANWKKYLEQPLSCEASTVGEVIDFLKKFPRNKAVEATTFDHGPYGLVITDRGIEGDDAVSFHPWG